MTEKRVLFGNNIHAQVYPASLTKKMTLYLLFQALRDKKITLSTRFKISKYAAGQPPCRINLKAGETISIKEVILGLIIKSCNGCSVVVAENLAGNVSNFVQQMNNTAKTLNLRNTHFMNPSGWHHKQQKTTAWDMTKLACALYRHFPEHHHFFKVKHFKYKGQMVHTHNRIGSMYPGAVGLKTGYHVPAGFNLTAMCTKKDKKGKEHKLVSVVMGEDSPKIREKKTCQLFDKFHFRKPITKRSPKK